MYSAAWYMMLYVTVAAAVFGHMLSKRWWGSRWRDSLLAFGVLSAFPPTTAIVALTELYFADFLGPIAALSVQRRRKAFAQPLTQIAIAALIVAPVITTACGVFIDRPDGGAWITYLYRHGVMASIFCAAFYWGVDTKQFFETIFSSFVFWVVMCIAGVLQAYAIIDVDFQMTSWGYSITESAAALRGFMGYSRAAAGLLGAIMALVALGLLLQRKLSRPQRTVAVLCIGFGAVAILFSGSRTSLLCFAVGLATLFAGMSGKNVMRGFGYLVVVLLATGWFFIDASGALLERFSLEAQSSLQARATMQTLLLEYLSTHLEVFVVGCGGNNSSSVFAELHYLSQAHSEYLQVLIETGLVGLLTYLSFLFALFNAFTPEKTDSQEVRMLCSIGRSCLAAGCLAGLATGHIMVTSTRMYTVSVLLLALYGAFAGRIKAVRFTTNDKQAAALRRAV